MPDKNSAGSASVSDVVEGRYCSGCGACAAKSGRSMVINEFGEYVPPSDPVVQEDEVVCPFLRPEENEDVLASVFLQKPDATTPELGGFNAIYAAHVSEGEFRANGSSGGVGTWLGVELLQKEMIDAVIHVMPAVRAASSDPFFKYGVSTTAEQIRSAAHSHYHVVEISQVMQYVRDNDKRYLFIGVPCFAKAVRRLQLYDPVFRTRIKFVAALVCGHLKSINWSLSLGWGAGVPPSDLTEIKFRIKEAGIPAKAYFFGVKDRLSTSDFKIFDSADIIGGKFNLGAMMLNACNFCDDIVGETADISIGDAWLPKYAFDWHGKNMVILRNTELTVLFNDAHNQNRLDIEPMRPKDATQAQAGGFRQRREGLAYRIEKKRTQGEWHPEKRIFSDGKKISFYRSVVYDLRQRCADKSRLVFVDALQENNYFIYAKKVRWYFKLLRFIELFLSSTRIIGNRIQRLISERTNS